jgi:hypothetical protein
MSYKLLFVWWLAKQFRSTQSATSHLTHLNITVGVTPLTEHLWHRRCSSTPQPSSHPLVLTQMLPRFSLSVLGLRSYMPIHCSLTVPQQEIFFWAKSSYRSGEQRKLSMYSLWPNPCAPPHPPFRVVTVLCVAVWCCATLCLSLLR